MGIAAPLLGCGSKGSQSTCASGGPGGDGDGSADSGSGLGGVQVGGTVENCPTVTTLSVSPSELDIGAGGVATLSATATAPFGAIPEYTWTAPSGTLSDPHAKSTTFACTIPGVVPITVTATNDGCSDHLVGYVTCRDVSADVDAN